MTATIQTLRPPKARGSPRAQKAPVRCLNCGLWDVCVPCNLVQPLLGEAVEPAISRRRVKAGQALYRSGDPFRFLYTIRSGFFKTTQCLEDGRGMVKGFYMAGEMLGVDGVSTDRHLTDAVALENSEVCAIQFSLLEGLNGGTKRLQSYFYRAMGREIETMHSLILLLGTMNAEERLAVFLLNLSERFAARGYSPMNFILRMTREDIGSYLGIKIETVSRMLSRLVDDRVIDVHQREIHILDLTALSHYVGRNFSGQGH